MTPCLSIIILAKNCASSLARTLASARFADEVLVIDDFSTDTTADVARSSGARVLQHALNGDFAAQRRFGVEAAASDWILFLDSDEVVTPELQTQIHDAIRRPPASYYLRRLNCFEHHTIRHCSMRSDRVLRLMPKEGTDITGRVHEKITSIHPTSELSGYLLHYTYRNWSETIRKLDSYTSYLGKQQAERGTNTSFLMGALLKPTWAFFKAYVVDRGFLDGKMGFLFAVHHAYYTFMKYAKWDLEKRTKGMF